MTNDKHKQRIKEKRRAKLLAQLEHIVGSNCYNGNIQNFGPGEGSREQVVIFDTRSR